MKLAAAVYVISYDSTVSKIKQYDGNGVTLSAAGDDIHVFYRHIVTENTSSVVRALVNKTSASRHPLLWKSWRLMSDIKCFRRFLVLL